MTENEIVADGGGPEGPNAPGWRLDRRGEALGMFQQVYITTTE